MFDDALLESRRNHSLGGKRLSLPVAVGLHLAVIGAFLGASAWFPGEAPEPPIPVVFPTANSSGPPPPPGGHEAAQTPRAERPRPGPAMTQPTDVPSERPEIVIEDPGPSEAETRGSDSSGPGSRDGVDGGTGDSRRLGPGTGVEEPIPIGGDVRAPVLLRRFDPEYPEAARRAHLQGTVILEAVITTSGAVQEIRVLKSLNTLLDEAAERAVRQWRYQPATLNGRVVPVYLTVTVTFGING